MSLTVCVYLVFIPTSGKLHFLPLVYMYITRAAEKSVYSTVIRLFEEAHWECSFFSLSTGFQIFFSPHRFIYFFYSPIRSHCSMCWRRTGASSDLQQNLDPAGRVIPRESMLTRSEEIGTFVHFTTEKLWVYLQSNSSRCHVSLCAGKTCTKWLFPRVKRPQRSRSNLALLWGKCQSYHQIHQKSPVDPTIFSV